MRYKNAQPWVGLPGRAVCGVSQPEGGFHAHDFFWVLFVYSTIFYHINYLMSLSHVEFPMGKKCPF